MAAKFLVPFLMASFLLSGASSTSWLPEASFTSWFDVDYIDFGFGGNGGGGDAVVRAEDTFVITDVIWTADESVSLTVCWDASLADLRQNVTGISLNGTESGELDGTGFCATFCDLESEFKLPSTTTTYIVDVQFSDGSSMTGSATFAMTVVTTLLDCDETLLTKVSWTDETTQLLDRSCIEEPVPLDMFCYYTRDLSNQELCFTVPNDEGSSGENITVCLVGPTDLTANITSDDSFSVNYLQYGEASGVSPTLSLTSAETVDAVIVETDDGSSTVHQCSDNTCPLQEQFMPSTNRYKVCADLDTVQTATTTFYDLQVTILQAVPPYLQFVFANALPNMTYFTSLWQQVPPGADDPLASYIVDCTEVEAGHGCFGELEIGSPNDVAYLVVANADGESNQVIVPYNPGNDTTTEPTTTTE